MKKFLILITVIFFNGCIGTDNEDDPKDSAILTDVETLQLVEGNVSQINAVYHYNMWTPEPNTMLVWKSLNNSIAEVDQEGSVTALLKGQTSIWISYPGEDTVLVDVTVVEGANDVAKVEVTAPQTTAAIGATIQFTVEAYTIDDKTISGSSLTWMSSDLSVASIDQTGLLTALSNGNVNVTAMIDGVTSANFLIMIGTTGKVGVFEGVGSYKAIGTATLTSTDGILTLDFSSDFSTSFALGTFVYLANSDGGTAVRSQGLEIAEVTTNGAKSYNISAVDQTVDLDTYKYVILLCKPASITFGKAELK